MGYITTDNGSLQVLFLINTGSLLSLSTIIVLSRLHCRFSYLQNVGLDDYLTIAALAIAIALGVMNGFHVSLGTGRHVSDLDLEETLIPTLKHWYAYQIVYPWTLFFVKASILAHYHRIFRRTKFCNAVYIVSMFVTVFTLVAFFVNLFECRGNFARAWSPTFPQGCNNIPTTYFSTATINILTDVTILLMPMRAFYQLDVGRRKRWALLGVFMGGGIAVLASIVRLYALWLYSVSQDVFFDAIYILLLSQIEVNMAIISASAPTLLPLFKSAFPSSPSSYNQPGTPYGVGEMSIDGHGSSAPNQHVELPSYHHHTGMENKFKPTKRCLTYTSSEEFIIGDSITKNTDMQVDVEYPSTPVNRPDHDICY
ncbi:hypothetical protein EG328_007054 [Venturia inaequalis]|uniref:Rhodopsin domain-containing protein n=1 Tax=Venturia inaequalis TaxID=5025 RepID=A0A8H3YT70_VENIN|nr:hypothetical protein EG328_007054 [Venturia inaequalis]RDI83255.1 hypothetical protein Vi05172_g6537 [Venturia inaequalis]